MQPNQPTQFSQPAQQQPERPYATPSQSPKPDYYHQGRKKTIVFWSVVVLLIAAGLATYMVFGRSSASKKPAVTKQPAQSQNIATAISTPSKLYTSTEFVGLSLKLPSDWTTTETTGSGVLTAISPPITLQDASSKKVSAAVVLKIRNKQQPLPEFDHGNAIAVLASDKIAYTSPSTSQRGSTYISFLQYASTTTPGLDGVYITGDVGYQAGQAIPKADIAPIDPVISITFVACSVTGSQHCAANGTALTLASSDWQSANLSAPLKAMLASLTVN